MLCSQLQVLRFLLEFLEKADTASWEETSPEILNREVKEVKQSWKLLKAEYHEKVKDIKELLPELLQKQHRLRRGKERLECVLQQYRQQREMAEAMLTQQVLMIY
ncbi:ZW10 interactor-like [Pelobates cultripes]|uniref:ZW10 interactor-like n=1 Tax=Pelobates cultripes TaxID=61616 RepID=A0AAD1T5N2_PELCU|nr:ZW10 interactor-like [Pelobates cultripes]